MHLTWSGRSYKGKSYKYWQLAESVRDGKKVGKKVIANLGELSDEKVRQIKMICKVLNQSDADIFTTLDAIEPISVQDYLEIAVANSLWDTWKLDEAFTNDITKSEIDTIQMARILTLNRCTNPKSHYAITKWVEQTVLPEMLQIDPKKLTDDKIYYELDKIERNKSYLEYMLFKKTYEADPSSYEFVNYDLTTSYFVGIRCKLAWYGRSKDHRPNYRQVVLGLMVNDQGYPFKWNVYPGNQPETKTLKRHIQGCVHRFGLKKITLVFDRGLVSEDNLTFIEDSKADLKYICALDRDQIASIAGDTLGLFKDIETDSKKLTKIYKQRLPNFQCLNGKFFFKDLGVVTKDSQKRYVLSFNPVLCEELQKLRQQKINTFFSSLGQLNSELLQAKRNRSPKTTRGKVKKLLKKFKLSKLVSDIELTPVVVSCERTSGTPREVNSYQISVCLCQDTLAQESLLDGVCVLVTNHIEREQNNDFVFPAQKAIYAYNHKSHIEDAFKHVKSFLKIRPFHVNLEQHVKAVYTICVLGYFINVHLARLRNAIKLPKGENEKYFLNSCELYDAFRSCKIITLSDTLTGATRKRLVKPTSKQKRLLESLDLRHLLKPSFIC